MNRDYLESMKTESLPCSVSKKTKRRVESHVRESEYSSVSEYVREVVKNDLEGDKQ